MGIHPTQMFMVARSGFTPGAEVEAELMTFTGIGVEGAPTFYADPLGSEVIPLPLTADDSGTVLFWTDSGPCFTLTEAGEVEPKSAGGLGGMHCGPDAVFNGAQAVEIRLTQRIRYGEALIAELTDRVGVVEDVGGGAVSGTDFAALTDRVEALETDTADTDAAARIAALEATVASLQARVTNLENPEAVPVDENPNPNLATAATSAFQSDGTAPWSGASVAFNGDGTALVPTNLNHNFAVGNGTVNIATVPGGKFYEIRMVVENPGGTLASIQMKAIARTASGGAQYLTNSGGTGDDEVALSGASEQEVMFTTTATHGDTRDRIRLDFTIASVAGGQPITLKDFTVKAI